MIFCLVGPGGGGQLSMKVFIEYVFLASIFASSSCVGVKKRWTKSFSHPYFRHGTEYINQRQIDASLRGLRLTFSDHPQPQLEAKPEYLPGSTPAFRQAVFRSTITSTPNGNFVHGHVPNIIPGEDPITYFAGSILSQKYASELKNILNGGYLYPFSLAMSRDFGTPIEEEAPLHFGRKYSTAAPYPSRILGPLLTMNGNIFPFRQLDGNFEVNRAGELHPFYHKEVDKIPSTNDRDNMLHHDLSYDEPRSFSGRYPAKHTSSLPGTYPRGFSVSNTRSKMQVPKPSNENNSPNDRNHLNFNRPTQISSQNSTPGQKVKPNFQSSVSFTPKDVQFPGNFTFNEEKSHNVPNEIQHSKKGILVPHYPRKREPEINLSLGHSYPEHVMKVLKYLRNFPPGAYQQKNGVSDSMRPRNIPTTQGIQSIVPRTVSGHNRT